MQGKNRTHLLRREGRGEENLGVTPDLIYSYKYVVGRRENKGEWDETYITQAVDFSSRLFHHPAQTLRLLAKEGRNDGR